MLPDNANCCMPGFRVGLVSVAAYAVMIASKRLVVGLYLYSCVVRIWYLLSFCIDYNASTPQILWDTVLESSKIQDL